MQENKEPEITVISRTSTYVKPKEENRYDDTFIRDRFSQIREEGSYPVLIHAGKDNYIRFGDDPEKIMISSFGFFHDDRAAERFADIICDHFMSKIDPVEKYIASELVKTCLLSLIDHSTGITHTWEKAIRFLVNGSRQEYTTEKTEIENIFAEIRSKGMSSRAAQHYTRFRTGAKVCPHALPAALMTVSMFEETEELEDCESLLRYICDIEDAEKITVILDFESTAQGKCFEHYFLSGGVRNICTKESLQRLVLEGRKLDFWNEESKETNNGTE